MTKYNTWRKASWMLVFTVNVVFGTKTYVMAQTTAERVDAAVQQAMTSQNVPGLSVAIVKNGTIAFSKGYGLADRENNIAVTPQTRFAIASVSKTMTALALMQLVEQGSVRLDADVNTYLPFQVRNPNFPATPITVQMLMTHTSSLNDGPNLFSDFVVSGDSPISLADFMRRSVVSTGDLFGKSAEFSTKAPGTEHKYTNMNTALMGYLVEVVARRPFNQYCNDRIFTPLCMNATRWFLSEFDSTTVARPYSKSGTTLIRRPYTGFPDYPDGQIRTNILDMSKYLWSLMNGGRSLTGSSAVVSPETLRRTLSPVLPNDQMGLHFFYDTQTRDTVWGHSGGLDDATAEMFFSPKDSIGVVFMANTSMTSRASTTLWNALIEIAHGIAPNPRNPVQCTLTSVRSQPSIDAASVEVSPNPASDALRVNCTATGVSVRMTDVLGNTVFQQENVSTPLQVSLSGLVRGSYYVVVLREGSVIATKCVVKM